MIDYLYYLKDKLIDMGNDSLVCSMLIHNKKEKDISIYKLIEAYFISCKEVQEKFDKMIKQVYTENNDLDNKIKSIFRDIRITNVTLDDDCYRFCLSLSTPFKESVYLKMRKKDDGRESEETNDIKLIKSCNDIGEYELFVINAIETKPLKLAFAAIFYENINSEELYNVLVEMEKVWRDEKYQVVTEGELPVSLELSQNGKVYLKSTPNDLCFFSARFNKSLAVYSLYCDDNITMQDDPIWYFENLYIDKDEIKNEALLANINKDDNILRNMFKNVGYGDSTTYNISNTEMEMGVSKSYFIQGEDSTYREVKGYKNVLYAKDEETYYFRFYDDSLIAIPKNKLLIVSKEINMKKNEAKLFLENKSR